MKLSLRSLFRKGRREKEEIVSIRTANSPEPEMAIQVMDENKKSLTFSNLPAELRLKIWSLLLSEPQFVEPKILCPRLHPDYKRSVIASRTSKSFAQCPFRSWVARKGPPLLLSICSESRAEALRHYRTFFTDEERTSREWIYFHPATDVLFYDGGSTSSLHTGMNCAHFFEVASEVGRIRALAVGLPWATWRLKEGFPFQITRLLRYFLWRCTEPQRIIWVLKHASKETDTRKLVEVARQEKFLIQRGTTVLPGGEARILADVHIDVIFMLDWLESPMEGCEFPCCADGTVAGRLAYSWDSLRDSSLGHLSGKSINTLQI